MERRKSRSLSSERRRIESRKKWMKDQRLIELHEARKQRKIREWEEARAKKLAAKEAKERSRIAKNGTASKTSRTATQRRFPDSSTESSENEDLGRLYRSSELKQIKVKISGDDLQKDDANYQGKVSKPICERQEFGKFQAHKDRTKQLSRIISFDKKGRRVHSKSPQPSTSAHRQSSISRITRPSTPPITFSTTLKTHRSSISNTRESSTSRTHRSPTSRTRHQSRESRSRTPPRHHKSDRQGTHSSSRADAHRKAKSREHRDLEHHSSGRRTDSQRQTRPRSLSRDRFHRTATQYSSHRKERSRDRHEGEHQSSHRYNESDRFQPDRHRSQNQWNYPNVHPPEMQPVQVIYVQEPMPFRLGAPYAYPPMGLMRPPIPPTCPLPYQQRFGPRPIYRYPKFPNNYSGAR